VRAGCRWHASALRFSEAKDQAMTLVPLTLVVVAACFALLMATSCIKIAKEYERGVVFRLGRLIPLRGPGLFFVIPFVDRVTKVDLRVITLEVPQQEVITADNVTV
jgi:regulator of protease activity HflC (stomatin/prohibitin superfamily)